MTPKKEKAIQALLTESNKKKAAEVAGISYRTLMNYCKDEEFMSVYRAEQKELIVEATRIAQRNISDSIQTLVSIAGDPNATATARIKAASSVLKWGLKLSKMQKYMEAKEE